jgi:hypothetical protein
VTGPTGAGNPDGISKKLANSMSFVGRYARIIAWQWVTALAHVCIYYCAKDRCENSSISSIFDIEIT